MSDQIGMMQAVGNPVRATVPGGAGVSVQAPVAMAEGSAPAAVGGCATCGQPFPDAAQAVASDASMVSSRSVGSVLAVGRLHASFPSPGHQREYAEAADLDPDTPVAARDLKDVLGRHDNRYLAWQVCWTFEVHGTEVCLVVPRHETDLDDLLQMLAPENDDSVQVLIGEPATGLGAPACWDADLPMVSPVQLMSFSLEEFAGALGRRFDAQQGGQRAGEEKPGGGEDTGGEGRSQTAGDPRWQAMASDVFARLTGRSNSTGFDDEDRARNYLALKDPAVYALVWQALNDGQHLIDVSTTSTVRSGRRLTNVRFALRSRQTSIVERYQCQVDTTDLFCFKASPLAPSYD